MSDLRSRCLTAMVKAAWPWEADAVFSANWRPGGVRKVKEEIARNALDAVLSVLADHADEWSDQAWEYPALSRIEAMLSVLKPTTEEVRE